MNSLRLLFVSLSSLIASAAAADQDYGTSVRRGAGSVGSYNPEDSSYGTSVRRSRQPAAYPQAEQNFSRDEDVSYGTSNPPGYAARRQQAQTTSNPVTYNVRHVAHKETGGYHVFQISTQLGGYHVYYVGPTGQQTYMGWRSTKR